MVDPVQHDSIGGCPPGAGIIVPEHGGQIGNPPHERTEELAKKVVLLARAGERDIFIAEELGIGTSSLYKYYGAEFKQGRREARQAIGAGIVKRAIDGNVQDAHLYMRVHGGWNIPNKHEHSGPDGGPIPIAALVVQLNGKSEDELAVLERFLVDALGPDVAAGIWPDGRSGEGVAAGGTDSAPRPEDGARPGE